MLYDKRYRHHNPGEGGGHGHEHTQTRAVINRLSRAIGHLESVRRMVEDGRDCSEVLVQIAAVKSAVNNVGKVILKDKWGSTSEAVIEDYATVWPPLPVRLSKLDYLFGDNEYKYAFTTVAIPAENFVGNADLSNITKITLAFDGPAHLRMDNIGLAP